MKRTLILPLLLALIVGPISHLRAAEAGCGNKIQGGVGGTGSNTPLNLTLTVPPAGKGDPVVPYTGNEYKKIDDLQIWGAVGGIPMTWGRYGNSREVHSADTFGVAHYWRHSFQWELAAVANDSTGHRQVNVVYPNGADFTFKEVAPGDWQCAMSLTDRLLPTAHGFVLRRNDATQYFFHAFTSGSSTYYLMDHMADQIGNVYTVEYNTSRQVTKVSEPAGRYFQVTYQVLSGNKLNFSLFGTLGSAPAPGTWMEFSVTNTASFRYVRVVQADMSYGNIAEVEFYEAGTNAKLSGTVICSDSTTAGQNALDGNPATGFVSSAQSGGFVGLDLGTAKKIGRIRVLSVAGKEALHKPSGYNLADLRVEGANEAPISTRAITRVQTSDGRAVDYQYTPVVDPTLPYNFPALTSVVYGDGTRAEYKYTQVFPSMRPLVSEWDDPRYNLRQPKYKTVYMNSQTSGILGAVESQVNLETGNEILRISLQGGKINKPMVTYANGGSEVQIYSTSLASGAAITQELDANNNATNYTYGPLGYMATMTDALGRITSYTWTPQGNPLTTTYPDGSVESWTYNEVEAVLSHTDPLGNVTTYTRDASNRVIRTDYPDASYETFAYNGLGQVISYGLRNGGTETFTYDARGLLTQKTDAVGNSTTYAYDSADRVFRATDALGHATTMEYNERGLLARITNPDATTRSFTYTKYGDVTSETNELGATWAYTYDVFRRVASITDPLGRTATTAYQPDSIQKKPLSVTSPSGRTATFTYDLAWNLLSTTNGAGTPAAATTTFSYDKVYNAISATDAMGKTTAATYDALNRKLDSTDPLGNVTHWTYDENGNVLTATRPNGGVTTNVYDEMDRLVQTTDPKAQTTTMAYDAAGNPASMTDPRGSVYSWTYDLLNRPTAMIYPGGSNEHYGYDAVGNPTSYTTRAGQTRTSVFDVRNRETQTNWSDATPSITRAFDSLGRVTSEDNGITLVATAYDTANQVTSETTTVTGQPARTISYTYDADGRRTAATYPGGNVVSTSYTPRSQIAAIGLDGANLAQYEYDAVGNVTAKNLENGASSLFTYDAAHRLTGIEHRNGFDLLVSLAYTLDKVGNRKSKTYAGTLSSVESYTYDAIDQLIQAKYDTTRTVAYTYDASGNRQNVTDNGTGQAYTANALNQYTSVGGSAQSYDANGNFVGTSGAGYLYDAQNRLVQATVGGIVTTFAYDPQNRVIQRTANGTTTNLTYDGWNRIEERDGSGALQQIYVHGAGVDEILTKITTTGAVYYHADALGSTVALTNETGSLVESTTYDAFGTATIRDASGTVLAASSVANRFLFTGREWLADAGIYDYRNRVYSPALGRFLQTDPIRFSAGDGNIYRYCGNSAPNRTDPFGLWAINDSAKEFSNLDSEFKFTPPPGIPDPNGLKGGGGAGTGGKGGGTGGVGGGTHIWDHGHNKGGDKSVGGDDGSGYSGGDWSGVSPLMGTFGPLDLLRLVLLLNKLCHPSPDSWGGHHQNPPRDQRPPYEVITNPRDKPTPSPSLSPRTSPSPSPSPTSTPEPGRFRIPLLLS